MSAFLVESKSIAAIADFIWHCIEYPQNMPRMHIAGHRQDLQRECREYCAQHNPAHPLLSESNLFRMLDNMNREALAARYEERAAEYFDMEPREPIEYSIHRRDPWQLLKTMQCYLYQCEESDRITETALYKCVERAAQQLQNKLVSEIPEYAAAEWK